VSAPAGTLAELTAIVEQQAAKVAEDDTRQSIDELANLDIRFHLLIANTSGNDIASEIVTHIVPAFCEGNKAILHVGWRADKLVEEHRAILEAIKAKDPAGAERAMRAHLERVLAEIRELHEASQTPTGRSFS
jgi:GntR family transcriptional repressor for pyruvate dehydrogenase complex